MLYFLDTILLPSRWLRGPTTVRVWPCLEKCESDMSHATDTNVASRATNTCLGVYGGRL
jgi:hypothetical protein